MTPFLTLNIVDGTVLFVLEALSVLALAYLLLRRLPARRADDGLPSSRRQLGRWAARLAVGAIGGALLAVIVIFVSEVLLDAFGMPLDTDTHTWAIASFAASGVAVANLWTTRWWRKVIAAVGVLLFLVTATVGINAGYGLNTTIASLFNITVSDPIAIPRVDDAKPAHAVAVPPKPLWQRWTPPASMPAKGSYGTVSIPNTASGFVARPAYLYLPPAALVPDAPALPLLIMMMGQPGGPESSALFLDSLNAAAAAHQGLAPIVLTIDQIGAPTQNPLCIDSPRGQVYTYVMTDVLAYVRSTLHVAPGAKNLAIGGYSNGGECALSFGAKHPEVFGSILDVSGEIGPSLGSAAFTLKVGFGGDQAFYDREQPLAILASRRYTDTVAIFTSGSKDTYYGPEVSRAEAAAAAAGMKTYRYIGAGVGHRADAVTFGVPAGLPVLYARWNLAAG